MRWTTLLGGYVNMKSFVLFMIFAVIVECVATPAIIQCVRANVKLHEPFSAMNIILDILFYLCINVLLICRGLQLWQKVGM